MSCLRFDLHDQLPMYLDGAATPKMVERIEKHLLDCSGCRGRMVRLRNAKSLLSELPKLDAPPFQIAARPAEAGPHSRFRIPSFVRHFAADALVASALFAAFTLLYTHAAAARIRPFDTDSFRKTSIASVAANHEPHVIVEGVVAEIAGADDEGSHRFKLADPANPRAFVVCEILDGDPLKAPKNGSRVRVWGVSRYDSSPDHQWYEIHPVLKVEIVR